MPELPTALSTASKRLLASLGHDALGIFLEILNFIFLQGTLLPCPMDPQQTQWDPIARSGTS